MHNTRLCGTLILTLLLSWGSSVQGQSARKLVREGNEAYRSGEFQSAEQLYRRALQAEPLARGEYNLGNSLYEQNEFEESIQQYERAAATLPSPEEQAMAWHNLGNAYFRSGKFRESSEAYKAALRLQPHDMESKKNLALSLQALQQEKQEAVSRNQEEGQHPENPTGEGPMYDQRQENRSAQQPSSQEGQTENSPSGREDPAVTTDELSRREAEQLLRIMEQEEKKVQVKRRKGKATENPAHKDW